MKLFKSKKGFWAKSHIMIALAVIAILFYFNKSNEWIAIPEEPTIYIKLIAVAVVFSMIPDIDNPNSIINKYATLVFVGVILISFNNPDYKKYGIMSAIILGLLRIVEHRTLIHSLLGAIIIAAPLYFYLGPIYFIVGVIAFVSHIVADNDFSLGWEKDMRLW